MMVIYGGSKGLTTYVLNLLKQEVNQKMVDNAIRLYDQGDYNRLNDVYRLCNLVTRRAITLSTGFKPFKLKKYES